MQNSDVAKPIKTLKGLMEGHEEEIEIEFKYSASLRIFGDIGDVDRITQSVGVPPTHSHRKGERKAPNSPPYQHDMWSYQSPLAEKEHLHKHLELLWEVFRPHRQQLLELKERLQVDVFCGYRSNCDYCGVDLPPESLEIFVQLQVPFVLSIIVL